MASQEGFLGLRSSVTSKTAGCSLFGLCTCPVAVTFRYRACSDCQSLFWEQLEKEITLKRNYSNFAGV